jgi:hypothetical protein
MHVDIPDERILGRMASFFEEGRAWVGTAELELLARHHRRRIIVFEDGRTPVR